MKRRTLTLTLCILVCVALIGVGFASWVITHESTETQTGNITVDTVDDKSHTITVLEADKDLSVYFGAPKEMNTGGAWLTNTVADKEDLVASFKIEVTNYKTAEVKVAETDGFVIKNGETVVDTTNYNTLFTHNITISEFTAKEGEPTTGVATVTITFNWGSAFKGESDSEPVNPYTYYNRQEFTSTLVNEAKTNLNKLAELNGSTFVLTIETVTKTVTA